MKKSILFFGVFRVILDFAAVCLAFIIAWEIRHFTDLIPGIQLPIGEIPPLPHFIPFVWGVAIALVGIFALNGQYSFRASHRLHREILEVLFLATAWIMLIMAYFFLRRDYFFSRLVLLYGWMFTVILIILFRVLIRSLQMWLRKKGIGVTQLLFVGNNNLTLPILERFQTNQSYRVLGLLTPAQEQGKAILGTIQDLEKYCQDHQVDEIIQITSKVGNTLSSEEIVEFCQIHHIRYRFIPDVLEIQRTNVEILEEEGIPIIELKPSPLDGWGRILKRLLDIAGSIIGIIVLSPLWFITALCVWAQHGSWKEILFRQKRLGQHGKQFVFYKFQSMWPGAEKEHEKLLATLSERKGLLKLKNDPRVTPVGRFIRRTSLDELPQLWNVLKGDMSLVGPRPHMPSEIERLSRHYFRVLTVKPGITGLAQVSGRSGIDFEEEVRFDLYYIQNWTLLADILILLKTIRVVLKKENAT